MSEILQYIPGNSPLHHLNPVTKLLLVILIVGLCVMSVQVPFLCFLIGVLVLGALFFWSYQRDNQSGTVPYPVVILPRDTHQSDGPGR